MYNVGGRVREEKPPKLWSNFGHGLKTPATRAVDLHRLAAKSTSGIGWLWFGFGLIKMLKYFSKQALRNQLTMVFNSKIGNESDIQKFIFKVICSARVYFYPNTKLINQSDNLASKLGVGIKS